MNTLPSWLAALLIGGAVAVVFGIFVARKAEQKKPIAGGGLARVLHYLGTVAVVTPPPTLLLGAFGFRIQFGEAAGICVGSLALGFGLLVIFAVVGGENAPA